MTIWITADDYGLHSDVNEAIEALARKGRLSAVSVMTHRDATLDDVRKLATERVFTGVHLTFTQERPLVDDSRLTPLLDREGRFPADHWGLARRLLLSPRSLPALRREASAQIERFLGLGLPLHFVNSHQHVHLLPPIWAALLALLSDYPDAAVRQSASVPVAPSRSGLVALSSRVSWRLWPLSGAMRIEPLGIDLSGRLTASAGGTILDAAPKPSATSRRQPELIFHPGLERPGGLRVRYGQWDDYCWQQEFEDLECGEIEAALAQRGWVAARPNLSRD